MNASAGTSATGGSLRRDTRTLFSGMPDGRRAVLATPGFARREGCGTKPPSGSSCQQKTSGRWIVRYNRFPAGISRCRGDGEAGGVGRPKILSLGMKPPDERGRQTAKGRARQAASKFRGVQCLLMCSSGDAALRAVGFVSTSE
ncbi:MAG: hypothetical protein N3D71_02400 [Burkholderiaceae bacterium]|nr:hypothetical protein [Burkholderiaceae bacterium]